MKKLCTILAVAILLTIVSSVSAADLPIKVMVDGVPVTFANQQPVIVNGSTLVPVRGVFEQMGFEVNWKAATKQAEIKKGNDTILISIDEKTFYTNGTTYELDVPAQLIGGSTMIPLRKVLESVGYSLEWDNATRTVLITSPKPLTAEEYEQKFFEDINEYRKAQGWEPLEWFPDLVDYCRNHASLDVKPVNNTDLRDAGFEFEYASGSKRDVIVTPEFIFTYYRLVSPETFTHVSAGYYNGQFTTIFARDLSVVKEFDPSTFDLREFELKVFELINEERTSRGIHPLIWDEDVAIAARKFSEDTGKKGHIGSDGSSFTERVEREKSGSNFIVGENAQSQWITKTPEEFVKIWMDSKGHKANILSEKYTHTGTGIAIRYYDNRYWLSVTQDFIYFFHY